MPTLSSDEIHRNAMCQDAQGRLQFIDSPHADPDRDCRNSANRLTPTIDFRVLTEHIGNDSFRRNNL
jgi:hypothetical protein